MDGLLWMDINYGWMDINYGWISIMDGNWTIDFN